MRQGKNSIVVFIGLIVWALSPVAKADWNVEMSAYDPCESGGDQSRYGDQRLKPSQFALDTNPNITMIAVSKTGGTYGMRGHCFKASQGQTDKTIVKQNNGKKIDLLSAIHSKIFVAADICSGCSNKDRVDVATTCDSGLRNKMLLQNVKMEEVDCPPGLQAKMKIPGDGGSQQAARKPASNSRSYRSANASR